jgi:hypothetical protein
MRHQPGGQAAATERQRHPDQLAELEAADRLQLGVFERLDRWFHFGEIAESLVDLAREPGREIMAERRKARGEPLEVEVIDHPESREVRFSDGRQSVYFYHDDNPGRRSINGRDAPDVAQRPRR